MNKRNFLCLALVISALLFSSCASIHSWMRAKPQPITDFLPHHELMKKQPDTYPFHYVWYDQNIQPVKYVRVAPVNTQNLRKASAWNEFDMKMAGGLQKNLEELGTYMQPKSRQIASRFVDAQQFQEEAVPRH